MKTCKILIPEALIGSKSTISDLGGFKDCESRCLVSTFVRFN